MMDSARSVFSFIVREYLHVLSAYYYTKRKKTIHMMEIIKGFISISIRLYHFCTDQK